jgi:outer membrane receptor protein involved in Fe transport
MSEDPCAGATPTATAAECANTGVDASQYGTIADSPAGQYNFIGGGNPLLQPEKSDTVSFGFIFTPSFAEGLIVSADYFNIEIEDAISNIPPDFTLTQCLTTGDSFFCDKIHRGAATGTLWVGTDNIEGTDVNIGLLEREGVDLQVSYPVELGNSGTLDLSLVGTFMITADEIPTPGAATIECVGFYDGNQCGVSTPEWAHTFRATWDTPWDLQISGYWRHVGAVDELTTAADIANFDSFDWFDLSGQWAATESIILRIGVNNVFDEEPPVSANVGAGAGNGNTFPGVYDARGRYWFMGFSVRL